uniref:Retrovirus-related Pol polyprotein from transposon TNT 1-94 n=1 Tax=Tanacetum cinerariifolium TaxID=118510 RepID=A0A6L2N2G2_TANCI|nr:retrovirus-related Pol polyprotein from transposon TNT 1-94 [Tanacetum cinerariifolium]
MAEDSKMKIDKFDGHDFGFWKMQIEGYMYQKKLHEPLVEAKPTGMKVKDWTLLDWHALGMVVLSLAKNVAYNIVNEKTTYDLFKDLSNIYEKPSASSKVILIRQLVNTKMKEGAFVADHVSEFNSILSGSMSVDIKFDDGVQALLLLSSLPESWLGTVTAVGGSTGTTKLKFDNIRDLIIREDIRRKPFGKYSNSLLIAEDKGRGIKQDIGQNKELEWFKLRSGKVRLADDKTLDIAGVEDVVLKTFIGITSITVNGKAAYELKEKFLDDLRDNAFSGTNGEDAVEHIEYFFKIVDPIDLPNVNYERVRLVVFPISLVGNASKWFDEFKGSVTTWVDLTENFFGKYYAPSRTCNIKKVDNKEGVTNKGFSDLEEGNNNDEHEIVEIFKIEKLFTHDIERNKTYEDYESELNNEVGEPWSKDGIPYEICDHIYETFRFKNGKTKWPTCNSNEDGFCNGGELSGMMIILVFDKSPGDFSANDLKYQATRSDTSINGPDHIRGPYININTTHGPYLDERNGRACNNIDHQEKEERHKEGRCNLFDDPAREPPVCKIRRFEMIKYSFEHEEEYVAINEYEYDDLIRTNEDACHAYQEIFRNIDEGWLVTRQNKELKKSLT